MSPFAPICAGREPCFPVAVLGAIAVAFVLLAMSIGNLVHGAEVDQQRAAVVHVGRGEGGSGVCVSPDGLIVTAAHCVVVPSGQRGAYTVPNVVPIRFPNRETQSARVIAIAYNDKQSDLALLRVDGKDLPFLELAEVSPGIGEPVTSIGYPNGHFARFESEVTWVGLTQDKTLNCVMTSHRANPGHSGGPLLNQRGQICGICSQGTVDVERRGQIVQSEQLSLWARVESIHTACKSAGITPAQRVSREMTRRQVLQVWYTTDCTPCVRFYGDYKNGSITVGGKPIDQVVSIERHDYNAERDLALSLKIVSVPTFYLPANGESVVGYTSPQQLDAELNFKLTPVTENEPAVELPVGQPNPVTPAPSMPDRVLAAGIDPKAREDPKPPADAEASDGTGLRVILLVRKMKDISWLQGQALGAAERFVETGLKKRINAVLGKRADVDICFERTSPERFERLTELIGLQTSKNAGVVILVAKKYSGFGESLVESVEKKLSTLTDGDWKHATVETVFERVDPDEYDDLVEALEKEAADNSADALPDSQSLFAWLLTSIGGLFAGARDSILGSKAKAGAK